LSCKKLIAFKYKEKKGDNRLPELKKLIAFKYKEKKGDNRLPELNLLERRAENYESEEK
jgi:hypothetical protein